MIEKDIDAAFTSEVNGMTYFFKDDRYWIYKNLQYMKGPKRISSGFPGIPNNIDAAFIWSGNGDIYFFKVNKNKINVSLSSLIQGDLYWKFDMEKFPPVHRRYPQPIAAWTLPGSMDAAFQWQNGKTYFFKDDEYYRFNDIKFSPQEDTIPYPRKTGLWWFGCKEKSTSLQKSLDYTNVQQDYIENEVGVGDEVLDVGDWIKNSKKKLK